MSSKKGLYKRYKQYQVWEYNHKTGQYQLCRCYNYLKRYTVKRTCKLTNFYKKQIFQEIEDNNGKI